MKLNKTILYATGAFLTLAFAGIFASPKVSAAIRAAFVEVVMPSNPFFDRLVLSPGNPVMSTGPNTGALGITNITITNRDSQENVVIIFAPLFSGGGCGSTIIGLENPPSVTIYVNGFSTQTITYPTPLVFGGIQGHTCVAAEGTGNIEVALNGFVN